MYISVLFEDLDVEIRVLFDLIGSLRNRFLNCLLNEKGKYL